MSARPRLASTALPGIPPAAITCTDTPLGSACSAPLPATLAPGLQPAPGSPRSDQFFGDIEAYCDDVSVTLSLPEATPDSAALIIEYQGCADWGFCYPPQRQAYPLAP